MATYIPNATQTTEPVESRTVESAALEFRTLKSSINTRIADLANELSDEEAARIAADTAETTARIAGDANLQTQNNSQDVRLTAIENALLSIGEGGLPGTVYVQRLSGTGAQTVFTLNAAPQSGNVVDIYINGIYQNKDTFTVAGADITFSEAPPAGTDNIEVQVTVTIALGETDASLVSYHDESVEQALDTRLPEIASYAALRAYSGPRTDFYVQCHTTKLDGGAGIFRVDSADTTSADNGGTVLMDASGRRWKREYSGAVNVKWFGAIADSATYTNVGTNSSAAFQAAINAALAIGRDVYVPAGRYHAYALTWGLPITWQTETGGVVGKGIRLIGDNRQTSIIYTNGNDFMDVRTSKVFAASRTAVISKVVAGAPSGKFVWSSATTEETGLARPRVICVDLDDVEFSRFDIGVDSDGFWGSKVLRCKGYFNRIGLNVDRVYNVEVTGNDWLCKTAVACPSEPTAFLYDSNHHSVGTYGDIFGVDETTLDVVLGNATITNNYFEYYGTTDRPGTTIWRFAAETGYGFDVAHNHINVSTKTCTLRKMRRVSGVDSRFLCHGSFHQNRVLAPSMTRYWQDELTTNAYMYFRDDIACTLAGSKLRPTNMQRLTATKTNISYIKGTTEPTPSVVGFNTYQVAGDVNMIPASGALVLQRGVYDVTVTARGYCTPATAGAWKEMFLRLTASGVHHDFKIVGAASGAADFQTRTLRLYVAFESTFTPTYLFPVTPDTGDEFTISQLTVSVEPVSVFTAKFFDQA